MFVIDTDTLTGIITRGDLQKTPVRMYLFALISLLEMHLQRIIQTRFSNDSWMIKLKEPRREKIRERYKDRKQRNEDIGLIDCLELCDKMTIIKKVDEVNDTMIKNNIANYSRYLGRIENIRNTIAHSQDLLNGTTWSKLFDTIEKLEKIVFILEIIELSNGVKKNLTTYTT